MGPLISRRANKPHQILCNLVIDYTNTQNSYEYVVDHIINWFFIIVLWRRKEEKPQELTVQVAYQRNLMLPVAGRMTARESCTPSSQKIQKYSPNLLVLFHFFFNVIHLLLLICILLLIY